VYILTYQYELQNDVSGSQLADVSGLHELEETSCVLSCIMSAGLMETVSVFASSAPEAELLVAVNLSIVAWLVRASYTYKLPVQTRCHARAHHYFLPSLFSSF
jgi:hypothetical protein